MNWRNIRIVKFNNGTFGVRKGWVSYKYADRKCWWNSKSRQGFEENCCTKDYEFAMHKYNKLINNPNFDSGSHLKEVVIL